MADRSGGDQSPEVPELVELLKRLGQHRRKVYEQTYGALELRTKLEEIAETLLNSIQDHDHCAAGKALCRFVTTSGVECCEDAHNRMLANLDAFMGARLAALSSGATGYETTFAELGPEAEAAFDLWDRIGTTPLLPGERDAYWYHPLVRACEWLEQRVGISRHDLKDAAFRLTTPQGLQGMDPLTGPGGRTTDAGQPDLLWMIPKFRELDRDGTTARLWEFLVENYPAILEEAGVPTDACDGRGQHPADDTDRNSLEQCKPSQRKAYFSFKLAEAKEGRRLEDSEAWDLLHENDWSQHFTDELTDYEPPLYATWARQLRAARKAVNEQKYTPRTHK